MADTPSPATTPPTSPAARTSARSPPRTRSPPRSSPTPRTNSASPTSTAAPAPACSPNIGSATAPNEIAAKVIAYAKDQLGKPYIYGGTGPAGYDCSGLTMMAYRAAGVTIPRTSDVQYWYGIKVPDGQEAPG